MKIVSFNVNSVRQRIHQLAAVIEQHEPEFIGLQETKVQDHEFPRAEIEALGYQVIYMGEKTHYGVALMSKTACVNPCYGFPGDDDEAQKRFIGGEFLLEGRKIHVFNGYFPQGESREHPVKFPAKRKFYSDLELFLDQFDLQTTKLIVMGDYNIAPQDEDVGIGEENAKRWLKAGKSSFLPEEREWFNRLLAKGLYDGFRLCHADEDRVFSWFDYRSKGFDREPRRGLRIDHLLVSQPLKASVVGAGVDYDVRAMTKPSDHAPAWVELQCQ
ncbi:MAG: exodeoxyribonuclease III [Gammaproteobacteria bacterium]|nr:exodeoxyribonuclease III [Gammaproteobacteria bacterium]